MRRRHLAIFMGILLVCSIAGCSATAGSVGERQEKDAYGTKEQKEKEEKGIASSEGEKDGEQTGKNKEDRQEVLASLPEAYRSAKGLELPAGTNIAAVVKNKNTKYWKAIEKGMRQAIKDLNAEAGYEGDDKISLTYEGPAKDDDAEGQINVVDAILAENPQAFCLAAVDMSALKVQLESAEENGIPVISFDSGLAEGILVDATCSTNNTAVGKEAADQMAKVLDNKGKVMVVGLQSYTQSILSRVQGFEKQIREAYPSMELAATLYKDSRTREEALSQEDDSLMPLDQQIREKLAEDQQIEGIFVTDEQTAEEVLKVLEEFPDRKLSLIGVDAGGQQVEAVLDGREVGTIAQNPYGMGYATIIAAARGIMEMDNDKVIDPGYQWLNSENIKLEENQIFLNN